ncbi:Hsp90 protein-domain-containing protein [Piptocephalis cylindrospora]|uniref:Hsp90 protein-domain-containing protein n=1 Tax=Piptocephalis cylindrospora TaxID=1907219 RepID=A0A4P9Y7E0_9FUNG|nr:Hsp90 protein-domain-containing protein [Piptocephalis cylindrospora]|eukprot:RKP14161.1 Hsp90 protein-domain-containing protein [Piptocephalis cylindrospora]
MGLSPEDTSKLAETAETFAFQTEVSRMLHLIINSVYKSKEVFLRELISNASDALDKLRFLSLTDHSALAGTSDLQINLRVDRDRRVLIISDTGIGMSRNELRDNLGTLAKSGTAEFLKALETDADKGLGQIGQFGVGFYSVFLVADHVRVTSRKTVDPEDGQQWVWESEGDGAFAIALDPRGSTLDRGTVIELHLKDEAEDFLNETMIEKLVHKHSQFVNFPIHLWSKRTEEIDEGGDVEGEVEDVPEEEEKEAKVKPTREVEGWQVINTQEPLWAKDPKDVSKEAYQAFFRSYAKIDEDPLAWSHFKTEGDVEFKALLFIPPEAPSSGIQGASMATDTVRLFVRRVFITTEAIQLPSWLSFIRVIVDADNLPLNVNRETLQNHPMILSIRRQLIRKALALFDKLSTADEENYFKVHDQYHSYLKLGSIEDKEYRDRLLPLLRFRTSKSNDMDRTLDHYIAEMPDNQQDIYFLTGLSLREIKLSPFLERVEYRGYEVLYLDDPLDEFFVQSNFRYNKRRLQSVAKHGLRMPEDHTEDSKSKEEAEKERFKPLIHWLSRVLYEKVELVQLSSRLTLSPAALVAGAYGYSGPMERIRRAQAFRGDEEIKTDFYAQQRKIFEINPKHPLILGLLKHIEEVENEKDRDLNLARVLYETTSIRSGFDLMDKLNFAYRVERVMRRSLGIELDTEAEYHEEGRESLRDNGKARFPRIPRILRVVRRGFKVTSR